MNFFLFLANLFAKFLVVSLIISNFAPTKPAKRQGGSKSYWNPEAENTVCKDSQREKAFTDVIIL